MAKKRYIQAMRDAGTTLIYVLMTPAANAVTQTGGSWTARLDSLRVFWYRRIVSGEAGGMGPSLARGVLGALSVRSRLEAVAARGLTPFVGRQPEVEALRHACSMWRRTAKAARFALKIRWISFSLNSSNTDSSRSSTRSPSCSTSS